MYDKTHTDKHNTPVCPENSFAGKRNKILISDYKNTAQKFRISNIAFASRADLHAIFLKK
jgi:hypothetical protein